MNAKLVKSSAIKAPKIGADPEVFVMRNGHWISAHIYDDLGTKEKPRKTTHGHVQVDGVALEFNIRPSKNKTEFVQRCVWTLQDLKELVDERDRGCSLHPLASVTFTTDYLAQLPEKVQELGCRADFDAYSMETNPAPDCTQPFRTGAGHVHVGWTKDMEVDDYYHMQVCGAIAREMDYYLGLPSLDWDTDTRRRELYGKAGAFRPKPYGMEYRVLSNRWLSNLKTMGFVFDNAVTAYYNVMANNTLSEVHGDFARRVINKEIGQYPSWKTLEPGLAHQIYMNEMDRVLLEDPKDEASDA